jgi:hypothetical protein
MYFDSASYSSEISSFPNKPFSSILTISEVLAGLAKLQCTLVFPGDVGNMQALIQ